MKNLKNTRYAAPIAALVAASLIGTIAISQQISSSVAVPNTFVAGTPAIASEVNDNFQSLGDAIGDDRMRLDSAEMRLDEAETRLNVIASTANLENVVRVAKSGGDFDSVATALDSIQDNSADKPYVVLVYPGVYDESEVITVREFIELRGVSRQGSVIRASRGANVNNNSAAVVELRDLGALSNLTVVNDGATGISTGVFVLVASADTRIDDVSVHADGDGGIGHFAFSLNNSDVRISRSRGVAEGASTVNTGLGCIDDQGAFAQPLFVDCEFVGRGQNSGIGMQLSRSAIEVSGGLARGDSVGISATVAGTSRIRDARVESLGLNPVYSQTGSASILSASVGFVGGDPEGLANRFRYVHCYKANFLPVVNGDGSSID